MEGHSNPTQEKQILEYLLDGNRITSLEALDLFGCFRLASRISELRKRYPINRDMIVTPSRKRIAQYYYVISKPANQ